jgi:hypothetical protein
MELIAILAGVLKDLIGALNPFRWFVNSHERNEAKDNWRDSSWIGKAGLVFGLALLLCFLGICALFIWSFARNEFT